MTRSNLLTGIIKSLDESIGSPILLDDYDSVLYIDSYTIDNSVTCLTVKFTMGDRIEERGYDIGSKPILEELFRRLLLLTNDFLGTSKLEDIIDI